MPNFFSIYSDTTAHSGLLSSRWPATDTYVGISLPRSTAPFKKMDIQHVRQRSQLFSKAQLVWLQDSATTRTQRPRNEPVHHRLSLRYRPPHAKALSSSIHLQPQTAHRASTNNLKSISIYISSRCSMHGSEESQNIEKDLFEVASTAHDFISCSTDVLLQCNVAGLVQSCYVYTGGDL